MGKIIGIDLGTTNSCVAALEGGKPVVIPNEEGARTTPSIVGFTNGGDKLVGQVAKRQALTNPDRTVFAAKRFMGRRFDSEQVQRDAERMPFSVVASERGDAWLQVDDKPMSPPEVSAHILTKMKKIAEDYLDEEVSSAVVTVPAYFNDSQRQATRDAGRIAGLEVERIINEPTAAALAFGADQKGSGLVAVYDLGGGTFDISILELSDDVFNVRATSGDTHLGGEDFDRILIDQLCERFERENGIDLRGDRMALQRLKEAAEKAKHELSSTDETDINLPFLAADQSGPKHLDISLSRSELEKLTEDLVDRTLEPCRQALKDAGIAINDIQDVLLVGGMTRMPLVQRKVADFFGRQPNREINPDEVVAIGAALQGAVLSGDIKNVLLLDVTPLTLGVETAGGVFTPLIPRNTTVPCRKAQIFTTAADNQPVVNVHVAQGERPMIADNQTLARFELVGIPPAPRAVPQIEVSFEIDSNGIVSVAAKDLGTGKSQSVRITAQSGLNEQEISRLVQEAEQSKSQDEAKRALAELRVRGEGLVYSTERTLEEYRAELDSADAELIQHDLDKLKAALEDENTDAEELEQLNKALETSAYRIAEVLYAEDVGG